MVRYFYAWTPLVIVVGAALLLCSPLALIALMLVTLVALSALARAIVSVPCLLSRAIRDRSNRHLSETPPGAQSASSLGCVTSTT